jgi:uncharacterized cupredoxin-like copper-binding protein
MTGRSTIASRRRQTTGPMIAPANRTAARPVVLSGMRRIAVLVGACVALGAGLALAGCGGGGGKSSENTSAGAPQQTVAISEKEYSLTPSDVTVDSAGTVAFKVTNNGQIAHALEVEGNGVEEETDTIQPGQSATLTVDLSKAGKYEMYCPIDGHKAKGMEADVTVGGSSSGGMTTTEDTTTDKGPGY